jgi:sugar phosphate permease
MSEAQVETSAESDLRSTGIRWRPYQIYVVVLLLLVTVCNYLDRIILGVLQEPIKRELALSDSQLGLLSGPAFALFYSVAGIPIARLAERDQPRRLLAFVVAVLVGDDRLLRPQPGLRATAAGSGRGGHGRGRLHPDQPLAAG